MSNLRVPPHDDQVEASILGAILLDKDAIVDVIDFLRPEHFYNESNKSIYREMVGLYEKRKPIDLITLSDALKKTKILKDLGGTDFLSDLLNIVPTSANIEHYARIVTDHATKRKLISSAAKISENAFSGDGEVKDILDKAEQEIFSISQAHVRRDFIPIKDALAESFDRLDELNKKGTALRGVATGFVDVDNKLAGMQQSNLLILAARPGQGKTAFVLNVSQFITVMQKTPVGFFSLEMSKEELVDRLLVSQANVDAWKLKTGRLSNDDFTSLSEAMGVLADAPLFIDDTPGINILEIRTKARRLQIERKAQLFIVDYLQLVDAGKRFENRVQEVSYVSQSLKNLARELRVPVLAVSQLSRAVESRGSRAPQLSDLRESGAIEQDADVVAFLYRDDPEADNYSQQIITKFLIAKHRNGPLAEIDLLFRGDRIRFYSMEKQKEAEVTL